MSQAPETAEPGETQATASPAADTSPHPPQAAAIVAGDVPAPAPAPLLKTPLHPGGVALVGLTGIAPQDMPSGAQQAAKPTPTENALVATLKPGEKILAIFPIIRTARWGAPWTSEVRRRSAQWQRVLDRDKRLSRTLAAPVTEGRPLPKGVRAVLYERK